ncbi:hypothetical protein [Allobaculum sp. JKK-2023]|uniref:hypothetical protein n=1 Tax=Allobaculum sp. JKK-2023 TaxID=3108943 RepID=UPI002B05881E|nr:hypothetical protein [Allobaculum sp. JKK-2023]
MKRSRIALLAVASLLVLNPASSISCAVKAAAAPVQMTPRLWGTITSDWLSPLSGSGVKVKLTFDHELATNRIIAIRGIAAINVGATNAWIANAPLTSTSTSVVVTVGYTYSGITYFEQYYLAP